MGDSENTRRRLSQEESEE